MDNQEAFEKIGEKCTVHISNAQGRVIGVYLCAYGVPQFKVEFKDNNGDRKEDWFYAKQLCFDTPLLGAPSFQVV